MREPLRRTYELAPAPDEYEVWRTGVRPYLADLPANALEIWQVCFTEMFNNAVDHSEGSLARVLVTREDGNTRMMVADNGVGIFLKVQRAFDLVDERHAILELTKGRITTDRENHSGQGIFMTSRLLDSFNISSGGVWFMHFAGGDDWIKEADANEEGTRVFMELADQTSRTVEEVAVACSSADGLDLARTMVPVALARQGNDKLVSRSQAKLLMARLDGFQSIILDFKGIDRIGQAFADQIFRVFASEHPGVAIIPMNANQEVAQMIAYAAQAGANLRKPIVRAED